MTGTSAQRKNSRRRRHLAAGGILIIFLGGKTWISQSWRSVENVDAVGSDLSLKQAKRVTMDVERELTSMIPRENTGFIDQKQSGVLLNCEGDRAYQWAGATFVDIKGELDPAALVERIIDDFSMREGFSADSAPLPDGAPGAHVHGAHGAGYLVNESPDRTRIEILSFSPCFILPDDVSPHGKH